MIHTSFCFPYHPCLPCTSFPFLFSWSVVFFPSLCLVPLLPAFPKGVSWLLRSDAARQLRCLGIALRIFFPPSSFAASPPHMPQSLLYTLEMVGTFLWISVLFLPLSCGRCCSPFLSGLLDLFPSLLTAGSRFPLQANWAVPLPVLQKCPLLPRSPGARAPSLHGLWQP